MNQTKKRLSIINLAISITDIETIQLQVLKLGLLKTDTKVQEILEVLKAENFAKAQRLIKVYVDTPMEDILQRASQQKALDEEEITSSNTKENIISEEDQKIIDEFQLFTVDNNNQTQKNKKQQIDINDFLTDTSSVPDTQMDKQEADFDALLRIGPNDVMPNNIELDISQDPNDSFFDVSEQKERKPLDTDNVPKDNFFDIDEPEEGTSKEKKPSDDPFDTLLTVKTDKKKSLIKDALAKKAETEKLLTDTTSNESTVDNTKPTQESTDVTPDTPKGGKQPKKPKVKAEPENYPPISYIRQKFVSMRKQYEPIQKGHDRFPTVETFLTTISQDGYKEIEIVETLSYIEKLVKEEKFAEAAQLLLVCASTESNFAQFMLARELYRGVLLRKKVSEAFTILTHMADDNYPEALCDLGQFYENGIGTGKDRKIAQELYKKAMEMGIKRAEKHYTRLKKQNKGFFRK